MKIIFENLIIGLACSAISAYLVYLFVKRRKKREDVFTFWNQFLFRVLSECKVYIPYDELEHLSIIGDKTSVWHKALYEIFDVLDHKDSEEYELTPDQVRLQKSVTIALKELYRWKNMENFLLRTMKKIKQYFSKKKIKIFWKKVMRFLKKNYLVIFSVIFILFFPYFVARCVECLDLEECDLDLDNLLSFFGTALGILASFITYRVEKANEKKERNKNLKPILAVDVVTDESFEVFDITVYNKSKENVSNLWLFDRMVSPIVKEEQTYKVVFHQTKFFLEKNNCDVNVTMDLDLMDEDGYPKYVQVLCDDIEGNMWSNTFFKINGNERPFYVPREIERI